MINMKRLIVACLMTASINVLAAPAAFTVVYRCKDTGAKLVVNSGWGESRALVTNSAGSYEINGKIATASATGLGGYIEMARSTDNKIFYEVITDEDGKHSISAGNYPSSTIWGNDCPIIATLDHTKGE